MSKNKKISSKLVSVSVYAGLCGVSFAAIIGREKRGLIAFDKGEKLNILGNPVKLVDISKYPVKKAMRRGLKA